MRSMVEGFSQGLKNPSTALRAEPLPRKSGGGIQSNQRRFPSIHRRSLARRTDLPPTSVCQWR